MVSRYNNTILFEWFIFQSREPDKRYLIARSERLAVVNVPTERDGVITASALGLNAPAGFACITDAKLWAEEKVMESAKAWGEQLVHEGRTTWER